MITCNLKGGLGNMMFQFAAMESLAKDNDNQTYYHNVQKNIADLEARSRGAVDYYTVFKNFNPGKNLQFGFKPTQTIPIPFEYNKLNYIDNICYDGFFQSEKWFAHNREHILELFEFNDQIKDIAKAQIEHHLKSREGDDITTCAIHVRRGDYLMYQNIHPTQSMEYYYEGMDKVNADVYFVFSDDIPWCRKHFRGDEFVFVENNRDYIDMCMMQMCDHQIICNSSFSWWPAWLNDNPDKIVVGPKKWFGMPDMNSSDIIPDSWIKL